MSLMLDRLYQKFDELSYTNKVFKVETIGGKCILLKCLNCDASVVLDAW